MNEQNDGIPNPDAPPAGAPSNQNDIDRLTAEIADLKQNLAASQANNAPTNNAPSPDQLKREFWKDPLPMVAGITQSVVNNAVQQIQQQTLPALMETARQQARSEDPEIFDKYQAEVLANVQKTHPSNHGNPEVWRTAFRLVKGNHIDDIIELRGKRTPAGSTNDGPAAPSTKEPPVPKATPLDEDEAAFVRKFRLSEERFRNGRKNYDNQGSGHPERPSSWDQAITFDSDNPVRPAARK